VPPPRSPARRNGASRARRGTGLGRQIIEQGNVRASGVAKVAFGWRQIQVKSSQASSSHLGGRACRGEGSGSPSRAPTTCPRRATPPAPPSGSCSACSRTWSMKVGGRWWAGDGAKAKACKAVRRQLMGVERRGSVRCVGARVGAEGVVLKGRRQVAAHLHVACPTVHRDEPPSSAQAAHGP
jgi:hypothetical protein